MLPLCPMTRSAAVAHVYSAFDDMEQRYRTIAQFRSEPNSSFLIDEFRPRVLDGLRMGCVEDAIDTLRTLHHKHSFLIQKSNLTGVEVRTLDVAAVFLCEEALKEGERLMYQAPPVSPRCWCVPFRWV